MAKKKVEAAEIVIKTTDGGSFKIYGQQVDKATKKTEKMGRAAQNTDRATKGVTQQSSNATKEFSKMATMQGGLVAVYATLAAQVFAVSAAFQFLKSSMETRNLIEGQKAFGAVTGVAYKTLTNAIQDATAGMLAFKDAASAGAIGVAAGLSQKQLEGLANAAKNASLALGRDLTDSFNRLIRGVTKAEPELLDELGIILRLENATTKYAVSIGKTREQLNAYERTQAVLNDVLDQAETKFSAIEKLMDPDAFALGQLTKEFDDMLMTFQEFLVKGLLPIIQFFKDNSLALVSAVGLFVVPIIKSLLPSLDTAFDNSMKNMSKSVDTVKSSFGEMRGAFTDIGDAFNQDGIDAKGSKAYFDNLGAKTKDGPNQASLNKRQIAAYRRHLKEKNGIYKKMNAEQRREFRRHLNMQEALLKGSTAKQLTIEKGAAQVWKGIWAGKTAVVAAATTAWQGMLAGAAALANKAFAAAGWLGMVALVVMGIKSLIDNFRNLDDNYRRSREETEKLTNSTKELNDELARMLEVRETGTLMGLFGQVEATGNALNSAGITDLIQNYNKEMAKGAKVSDDVIVGFRKQAVAASNFAPGLSELAIAMNNGRRITDEQAKAAQRLANEYINAGMAAKSMGQNQETLNKALDKQIRKFTKIPFQDLLQQYDTTIKGAMTAVGVRDAVEGESGIFGSDFVYDKTADGKYKGAAAQFGERRSDRAKQMNQAQAKLNKIANETFGGAFKEGGFSVVAERDADGNVIRLKEQGELQRELNDAGIAQGDWMQDVYELTLQKLGLANNELQTIKDINEVGKEDTEEFRAQMEILRQQRVVRKKILDLQTDGIDYEKDRLKNLKDLTHLQTLGNSLDNQGLIIAEKKEALTDVLNKKTLAVTEAGVAQVAVEEKLKGILKAKGFKLEELAKMTTKELRDKAVGADISVQELDNSIQAVANAQTEEDIQRNKNKLTEEQLNLQASLLINQQGVTDELRNQASLARSLAVSAKQIARDLKLGGGTGASKRAARNAKLANLRSRSTQNTASADAYKAQREDVAAGAGFGTMGATDADGLIIATQNDAQKKYNELLRKEIALRQQNKLLAIDILNLTSENAGEFIMANLKGQEEAVRLQREQVFSLNPAVQQYNETVNALRAAGVEESKIDHETIKATAIEMKSLQIETDLMSGIQNTLSEGFTNMFMALIDGSKSFGDAMKDLTKQVLADLAAMFVRAAALKAMMALFPGMGSLPGMGARYGGIMSPSGKSFAYGGVATGPRSGYAATLHGTEAVVPLGNDRSIPVEMTGNGGGGNTVNVSVNVSSNGQSAMTSNGGGALEGMGRQIGALVQQHLQQEMRPGGILNSQGNRSR